MSSPGWSFDGYFGTYISFRGPVNLTQVATKPLKEFLEGDS